MTHVILGVPANCETSDFERSDADFELHGIWTVSLWDSISGLPDLITGHTAECHVESQSALKAEFLSPGMGYSGIYPGNPRDRRASFTWRCCEDHPCCYY